MNHVLEYLPAAFLIIGISLGLWIIHWLLIGRHKDLASERKLSRHLMILAASLLGVLAVVLALPIPDSSRNQLIAVIGLLISGVIAFSSTNIIANLMGGILLRTTKPFRVGDFIRVEQHFGRVTEWGMFDTEIQTEYRELVAIPNSFLISHPICTTRSSGAIISTTLSLGYDVHHAQVGPLLRKAASESGLKEPFVHVMELGDFSVTYRVSGLLEDTKRLITSRSDLCRDILDTLHENGIEIMSPAFMNQRRMSEGHSTIPSPVGKPRKTIRTGGEHVAFDKADKAEQMEKERQRLTKAIKDLEATLKQSADDARERIKQEIEASRALLKELDAGETVDVDGRADSDQSGAAR